VTKLILISILFLPIFQVYADDILVEEHYLGNVTKYFEKDITVEKSSDCIAPSAISRQTEPVRGFSFRIIVPDNNYCWLNVVLSEANYTALQNNIGIFTVKDRTSVVVSPTHNYCQLAYWIWNGETQDYQDILKKYPTKYIFPDYCYEEIPNAVIPEFSFVVLSVLIAGVTGMLILGRMK